MSTPSNPVMLAHWRRTIAALYAHVRGHAEHDPRATATQFREARDELFRTHSESPIAPDRRAHWPGTSWYPYDLQWRVMGRFEPVASYSTFEIPLAGDGVARCTRVGTVAFEARGQAAELALFWFEGYGGGLWLPFADATSGRETYGGGRYLYDTIKGADLGAAPDRLVLDFNFAYNPSCAYDARWSCPLSPAENNLAVAVTAGERWPA